MIQHRQLAPDSPRRRGRARLVALAVLAWLPTACTNPLSETPFGFDEITVRVFGEGDGDGVVEYDLDGTPRRCAPVPPTATTDCIKFEDAGSGGSLTLIAIPDSVSAFGAWTGCNSISGVACVLTFASGGDQTLTATVRFDLDACSTIKATVPNSIAGTGPATPADLSPAYGAEALANPSFEQVVTIGTVGQLVPSGFGYWQGDRVSSVGPQQGVTPRDGASMLHFIATGLVAGSTGTAEMLQLVKVTHLEPDVADDRVRATFRATFNRVAGCEQTDANMLMVIAAMPGDPSESQARWSAGYLANTDSAVAGGWLRRYRAAVATDADTATWQSLQLIADLPPGTTYIVAAIGASENVSNDTVFPELHGHYADSTSLTLSTR